MKLKSKAITFIVILVFIPVGVLITQILLSSVLNITYVNDNIGKTTKSISDLNENIEELIGYINEQTEINILLVDKPVSSESYEDFNKKRYSDYVYIYSNHGDYYSIYKNNSVDVESDSGDDLNFEYENTDNLNHLNTLAKLNMEVKDNSIKEYLESSEVSEIQKEVDNQILISAILVLSIFISTVAHLICLTKSEYYVKKRVNTYFYDTYDKVHYSSLWTYFLIYISLVTYTFNSYNVFNMYSKSENFKYVISITLISYTLSLLFVALGKEGIMFKFNFGFSRKNKDKLKGVDAKELTSFEQLVKNSKAVRLSDKVDSTNLFIYVNKDTIDNRDMLSAQYNIKKYVSKAISLGLDEKFLIKMLNDRFKQYDDLFKDSKSLKLFFENENLSEQRNLLILETHQYAELMNILCDKVTEVDEIIEVEKARRLIGQGKDISNTINNSILDSDSLILSDILIKYMNEKIKDLG